MDLIGLVCVFQCCATQSPSCARHCNLKSCTELRQSASFLSTQQAVRWTILFERDTVFPPFHESWFHCDLLLHFALLDFCFSPRVYCLHLIMVQCLLKRGSEKSRRSCWWETGVRSLLGESDASSSSSSSSLLFFAEESEVMKLQRWRDRMPAGTAVWMKGIRAQFEHVSHGSVLYPSYICICIHSNRKEFSLKQID